MRNKYRANHFVILPHRGPGVILRPIMQSNSNQLDDRLAITQLLVGWGLWRDTCNWTRLRACYSRDAQMRTTWFDGPAADFVTASERMASSRKVSLQHFIGTPIIELNQDRALAMYRVVLLVRGELDGVPVDATCYGRFHDRLVKRGGWQILRREPVYEKDRIEPVEPGSAIELDAQALAQFPAHYRYLAYMQWRGGATITPDLPAPLSEAERTLAQEDTQWLQEAGAIVPEKALPIFSQLQT